MSIFKKKTRFKCAECGKLLSDEESAAHLKVHEEERRAAQSSVDLAELVNKQLKLLDRLTAVLAELLEVPSARQAYVLISESIDCVTDDVWQGILYPTGSVGLAQELKNSIEVKQFFNKRINSELKLALYGTVELKWKVPSFIASEMQNRSTSTPTSEMSTLDMVVRHFRTIPLTINYTGAVQLNVSDRIYSDLDVTSEEYQAEINAIPQEVQLAQAKLRQLGKETDLFAARLAFLKKELLRVEAEKKKMETLTETAVDQQSSIFQEVNSQLNTCVLEKLYIPS